MNTLKETVQFSILPRVIHPHEVIINLKGNVVREVIKDSFKLESFSDNKQTGHLLICPLFSVSRPEIKQAVLFAEISYSCRDEAEKLIREGLMCSWELGYHVAFAGDHASLYLKAGFDYIPVNSIRNRKYQNPLFVSELTWDGLQQISDDLEFPYKIELSNN